MEKNIAILDGDIFAFKCPNCDLFVQVGKHEVNCRIFRHAYFFRRDEKGNAIPTEQLNPHAPQEICEKLLADGRIIGCGKPFKMTPEKDRYLVETCGYI